eukprot:evm.model.scf_448.6 EVM.evm.TU.scf_448.6   scf_448:70524-72847(-)
MCIEENEALFEEASALGAVLDGLRRERGGDSPEEQGLTSAGRSLVEEELWMLVHKLQECTQSEGAALEALLPRETPQDEDVALYISARASSHASECSSSRPSTASAPALDLKAAVETLRSDLHISAIDSVVGRIRQHLAVEKEALMKDIQCLQACLEEETELRDGLPTSRPSERSLKAYTAKIRNVWMLEEARSDRSKKIEAALKAPTDQAHGAVGRLRSLVAVSRSTGLPERSPLTSVRRLRKFGSASEISDPRKGVR